MPYATTKPLLRAAVIEIAIKAGLNVLVCFMSHTLLSVLDKGFIVYRFLTTVVVLLIRKCFLNCLRKVFLNTGHKRLLVASKNA